MDPAKRTLLRVVLLADDREGTANSVERLMGTKAEAQFAFISDKRNSPATICWTSEPRATFIYPRRLSRPCFRPFSACLAGFCPFCGLSRDSFSGGCAVPATAFRMELRIVLTVGFGNRCTRTIWRSVTTLQY